MGDGRAGSACATRVLVVLFAGSVFVQTVLAALLAVGRDLPAARRKMSVGELAERVGITPANLAVLKNGRARAVRFATLAALCEALDCQPGDLLRWEAEDTSQPVTTATSND